MMFYYRIVLHVYEVIVGFNDLYILLDSFLLIGNLNVRYTLFPFLIICQIK